MSLGVEVRARTAPPGRGAFSQTDTLFLAGPWSAGSTTEAVLCRSIADVEAAFAGRTGNTLLWDYLDNYFREGGRRAHVGRYTLGAGNLAIALDALFPPDLGPGQVVAPSETMNATNIGVLGVHAASVHNRVALIDVANGDTVAAMDTIGDLIQADPNDEYLLGVGPWVEIPPPAGVVGGTVRQVHGTSTVAALIARADALGHPNRAAAGRDFPLQYGTGFVRTLSMAERIALLNVGLNTFADRYGVLQLYGFQSGVAQSDQTPYWQFNCSRARMWLKSMAGEAGENYMFKQIDGRGRLARALKTDLDQICLALYQADGLYGETPEEAFATEVGEAVNTELTVAQGELHAVVEARLSLHAKRVLIDLVTVPVTGQVSSAA